PEADARSVNAGDVAWRCRARAVHRDLSAAPRALDRTRHGAVADVIALDRPLERGQRDAPRIFRTIRAGGELLRPLAGFLRELGARDDLVHESPFDRPPAFDALLERTEHVGAVTAHPALVDQAREAAGAGQDREQRHLGQRDRRVAVVGHQNVLAGHRELVPPAGARPIHDADPRLLRLARGFLDGVARLVRELAEVHLEAVRRLPEHPDIRARAEDALLAGRQHDRADLGMLEA